MVPGFSPAWAGVGAGREIVDTKLVHFARWTPVEAEPYICPIPRQLHVPNFCFSPNPMESDALSYLPKILDNLFTASKVDCFCFCCVLCKKRLVFRIQK